MMNSNVPNLITVNPSAGSFSSQLNPERFAGFFPADLIAHPNIYDLELNNLFGTNAGVLAIWETGQAGEPDALQALNDAVITIAVTRFGQTV